jgi:hypothetical protein
MTKFFPQNHNPTYSNPLTSYRENYQFEIMRLDKDVTAFSDRKPRRDSKFAGHNYVVWDLRRNEQVYSASKLNR